MKTLRKKLNLRVFYATTFASAFLSLSAFSQYCTTGLYSSGCQYGDDVGIVQFNSINNSTNNCPGGATGYADYTNISTVVCRGDSVMLTVGTSSTSYDQGFGVWIDFNNDSDFVDAGEFVYASPGTDVSPNTFSGLVYIPTNVAPGPKRLRVRGRYASTVSITESCTSFSYGETEDYTVIIGGLDSLLSSPNNSVACYGDTTSATVTAYGGLTPYSYAWDSTAGSQTTATATGLTVGTYTVQVMDSFGCALTDTVVIPGPPQIITVATGDFICYDDSNGTATVNASGGIPPFSYQWGSNAGNQTTSTATGLPGGVYVVTVTDSIGCSVTDTATVDLKPQLIVAAYGNNASSLTNCDGSAVALPSSNVYPFSYQWDDTNNQTMQAATGLCPGTYHVTVTDGNNCTAEAQAVVGPVVGIEDGALSQYVSVYPNPSDGRFVVEAGQLHTDHLSIDVINILGEQIYSEHVTDPGSSFKKIIDLSSQSSGLFRLKISTDWGVVHKNIVIK